MKKSLFALAALSAFTSAAYAQSSVTVYGTIDTAVRITDSGTTAINGKTTNIAGGTTVSDRLGFRGVEDLGGGRSAIFQIESGMAYTDHNPNTSTGAASSATANQPGTIIGARRPTFVGLDDKNLGRLQLGSQYSPGFRFTGFGDVAGTNVFGTNISQGMVTNSATDTFSTAATTADFKMVANSASYVSPTFSGANIELFASAKETAANGFGGMTGAMLNFAYQKLTLQAYTQTLQATNATTTVATKATNWGAGAGYDFGIVNTRVSYQKNKYNDQIPSAEITVLKVSAMAPITKTISVHAGYATLEETALGTLYKATGTAAKANVTNIGAVYTLSKRTNLYANYAKLSQGTADKFLLSGSASATTAGLSPSQIAVGVRHTF